MKVKLVKGIKCPECDEFVPKGDIPEVSDFYECGECERVYEDKEEAKGCCEE